MNTQRMFGDGRAGAEDFCEEMKVLKAVPEPLPLGMDSAKNRMNKELTGRRRK